MSLATAGWLLQMNAGEAVRFTDAPDPVSSRSGTEQKVRTSKDSDFRGIRSRTGSERGVTMPNVPLPPPAIAAPALTDRERDEIDRRQNWIFQTPDSRGSREGVEDAFGVESYRLDKEWGTDRRKSDSLTRFIEREPLVSDEDREHRRRQSAYGEDEDSERAGTNDRRRRTSDHDFPVTKLGDADQEYDSRSGSNDPMTENAYRSQDDARRIGFNGTERMNLRPRFGTSTGNESAGSDSPFRLRGSSRLTARDFSLPSNTAATTSKDLGGNDPVNLFPDLTKQTVNPVTVGSASQNSTTRPVGTFDSGFTRSPITVRPRFGDGVGSSFNTGPSVSSVIESRPVSSSKLFKNPVAIEMPKRGF